MTVENFEGFGFSGAVMGAVRALGFESPSAIQVEAIPLLLEGGDLVGISQTGSGKTAAFVLPIVERVDPESRDTQALILCPTRELASQVASEVYRLGASARGIHSVPIYGGAPYSRQLHELGRGAQIVIGTPGRVIDHIERGTLKLGNVSYVVLDEADRMLDMGFRDEIETILSSVPVERQTAFFSATMSEAIKKLVKLHSRSPRWLEVKTAAVSAPDIEQWSYEVPPSRKSEALIRLLDYHAFKLAIVFCNTQRMVDELADTLAAQGFSVDKLHGGISQSQRTHVMNKFKKSGFEILVATDVAARGIDVDSLEAVINFDLPYDAEDYVHRIGRTGRAGRRGVAVSIVTGRDLSRLRSIQRSTKATIQRGNLPSLDDVEEKRVGILLERVREVIDGGQTTAFRRHIDGLLEEGLPPGEIAAALFSMVLGGTSGEAPGKDPLAESPGPLKKDHSRDRTDLPGLPHPAPGKAWVRLGVGRADGMMPRDIVSLLAEGIGMDPRAVGTIRLEESASWVQIPASVSSGLSSGGQTLLVGGEEISIQMPGKAPQGSRKKADGRSRKPIRKPHRKKGRA